MFITDRDISMTHTALDMADFAAQMRHKAKCKAWKEKKEQEAMDKLFNLLNQKGRK